MKKLFLTILTFGIIVLLTTGCSPKYTKDSPEDITVRLMAKNGGFVLGQELPDVAQLILKYSTGMLDKIDVEDLIAFDFHRWADNVIDILDMHNYYKMNFRELVRLVDIQVKLVPNTEESTAVFYSGIIEAFVEGIRIGLED
jgi:hypothetical protein